MAVKVIYIRFENNCEIKKIKPKPFINDYQGLVSEKPWFM